MTRTHKPPIELDIGKARLALGDADTPAFVLLVIAMWAFGDEVLGDPEDGIEPMDASELWSGLNEIFGTWVTEEGENKLNALILALQGDLFYRDVEVFQSVAQALLDGDLGDLLSGAFTGLTSTEIMWAILEVELVRDGEQGPPHFSHGVADIISHAMQMEQDDQTENAAEVQAEYHRMLGTLREIGVPISALRLLDAEFAETMEAMESPEAIQAAVVS